MGQDGDQNGLGDNQKGGRGHGGQGHRRHPQEHMDSQEQPRRDDSPAIAEIEQVPGGGNALSGHGPEQKGGEKQAQEGDGQAVGLGQSNEDGRKGQGGYGDSQTNPGRKNGVIQRMISSKTFK